MCFLDKKVLAVYISGGVLGLLVIIFTIVLILGMQNKPVNICTTPLTFDMAYDLLRGYCGVKQNKANEYIKNKNLEEAYEELLNNTSDIVLATDVDAETIKWLKLNDVEIEKVSIAKDALVFVNNINNPVENLTSKQIKGIFSEQLTNWKNVGGVDKNIVSYVPVSGSEEEYAMEIFMGSTPLVQPRYMLENTTIDGLVDAVSDYLDTREQAIFYTTFYNMKNVNNPNVKLLNIDDIEVSKETIKSGRYNGNMEIYAIIRSDTPENSQARKFVEYITSKDGQAIIENCGYVGL